MSTRQFSTGESKVATAYKTSEQSWGTEYAGAESWKLEKQWEEMYDKVSAETKSALDEELSLAQKVIIRAFLII